MNRDEISRLINWLELHGYHETAKSVLEAFSQELRRCVRNSSSQVVTVIQTDDKVGR